VGTVWETYVTWEKIEKQKIDDISGTTGRRTKNKTFLESSR